MNAGKPDSVQVFYRQRSVVKGTGPLKNGHSPSVPAIGPARHFALPPGPLETGGFLRFRETGTKTGDRLAQNHPERRACAPLKDAAAISDSEGEAHDDNCFGSVFSMWWRHEAGADGRRGAYVYSVWFRALPGISDRFARRPALSNTSSLLGEGGRGSPQATGRSGNRVGGGCPDGESDLSLLPTGVHSHGKDPARASALEVQDGTFPQVPIRRSRIHRVGVGKHEEFGDCSA